LQGFAREDKVFVSLDGDKAVVLYKNANGHIDMIRPLAISNFKNQ
jgi:hypothetical protein